MIKRRDFIKDCAITIGTLGLAGCSFERKKGRDSRPNIVFILADDMGYGDIQAYNPESSIPTPHLNRLAGEGIRFTDAHSGSAVCTPTRYGILTGRYSWRTRLESGVLWGYSKTLIPKTRMTVASLLKQNGYATACVGKWHLGWDWATADGYVFSDRSDETGESADYSKPIVGGPIELGFDYFFGLSLVLVAIGNKFSQASSNASILPLLLQPRALLRLTKGVIKSKLAKRPILPRDLWSIRGILSGGLDSFVYKDKIKELWGRYPLEAYAGSEIRIVFGW